MTPTITAFRAQVHRRLRWFLIALAAGAVAALVFRLTTDTDYPAWEVGLLVHGFIFWPYFLVTTFRKSHVSTREAWRARRELRQAPPGQS